MPEDAKLGLLVGVGVVLAIALTYFKPEQTAKASAGDSPPAQVRGGLFSPVLPANAPGK
jgi:hypothetical protein